MHNPSQAHATLARIKPLLLVALVIVAAALALALPLPAVSGQSAPDEATAAVAYAAPQAAPAREAMELVPPIDAAGLLTGSTTIPLYISVTYQLHGPAGTARWMLPVVTTVYTAGTSGVIASWTQTTDGLGGYTHYVTFPNSSGSFDIQVKNAHTLSNKKFNILILGPVTAAPISMGMLLEGDADGNDAVGINDFSTLKLVYGQTCAGGPPCDKSSDFNEDGLISILDFSLLRLNYIKAGPITVP